MTATERLRELLDERGVEWTKPKRIWWELIDCEPDDSVTIVEGVTIEAATDGTLVVYPLTPEQAIAATLGSGTCHMEYCDEWSGDELYPTEAYVCSACGYITEDGKPNYCPNCGRKVVDE